MYITIYIYVYIYMYIFFIYIYIYIYIHIITKIIKIQLLTMGKKQNYYFTLLVKTRRLNNGIVYWNIRIVSKMIVCKIYQKCNKNTNIYLIFYDFATKLDVNKCYLVCCNSSFNLIVWLSF